MQVSCGDLKLYLCVVRLGLQKVGCIHAQMQNSLIDQVAIHSRSTQQSSSPGPLSTCKRLCCVRQKAFFNLWDTGRAAFYMSWPSTYPTSIMVIFLLPASSHRPLFPHCLSHVNICFIYYWAQVKSILADNLNVLQHWEDLGQGHRLFLLQSGFAGLGRVQWCIWLCWWHNDVFANAMGAVGMHLRDWHWCRKGIKYERCCMAKNNDIPI